jgi:hypothetical protein
MEVFMIKRAKILRDTANGPGLLSIEGRQLSFTLEAHWRSDAPPVIGATVDVDLDEAGAVRFVRLVSDSQLAKEQAEVAMTAARVKGAALVARVGGVTLAAAVLLVIGWFFLASLSIDLPFGSKIHLTFWQILELLNVDNPAVAIAQGLKGGSAGFYGFLAIASIAGPFLSYFWKDRRAALGGLLPAVFMLFVAVMVRNALVNLTGGASSAGFMGEMMARAREEMLKAISVGAGVYVSLAVSAYFAFVGARRFLARSV